MSRGTYTKSSRRTDDKSCRLQSGKSSALPAAPTTAVQDPGLLNRTAWTIARKFGKAELDWEAMVVDKDVTGAVLREVISHGKRSRLERFEVPGAVTLTSIEWTPETGLTTAAMKLKRKPLTDHYDADIRRMYGVTS